MKRMMNRLLMNETSYLVDKDVEYSLMPFVDCRVVVVEDDEDVAEEPFGRYDSPPKHVVGFVTFRVLLLRY